MNLKATDIRVRSVQVAFSSEKFRTPFKLSSGIISEITYASVVLEVENRDGTIATGRGGVLLSDLWAFPSAEVPHPVRDEAMRSVVNRLAERYKGIGFGDPFDLGERIDGFLPDLLYETSRELGLAVHIPLLAGLVCLSPFDAALHDGWARCAGRSAYSMYNEAYLNDDMSRYLGPAFKGEYPGDYLTPQRRWLAVQHVVGVGDTLRRSDEAVDDPKDGLPNSLEAWIEKDRVHWLKVKVTGSDLNFDVQRIADVYHVGRDALDKIGSHGKAVRMGIDPNEACEHPSYLEELLVSVKERSPEAYAALDYIEQPTGRHSEQYTFTLHQLAQAKPVVADESLDDIKSLPRLLDLGWSGVALKSCKGQGHTLLTYCWAKKHNLYITMQDLTNPGLALVHSAGLAAHLDLSVDCLEYNSRQYSPHSCLSEREGYEALFVVKDGIIDLGAIKGLGLY